MIGMSLAKSSSSPVRMLPLYGTVRLPSLTAQVLREHASLGANTVLVCVTEEDFLYYRENISKVIIMAQMYGFKVYANAWGYGGLVGGEALSASELYFRLMGEKRYLNSVHRLGPDAEITAGPHSITDSPVYQIKRIQELVAAAGAEAFFYDEIKIQRPGRNEPGHIELETFIELARHAHDLGLRNSLCVSVLDATDLALLERLVEIEYVDEVSFTHYYSIDTYEPAPERYLGPSIDHLRRAIAASGREVDVLGWVQGFDLRQRGDVLVEMAEAWRNHGVERLGIWGGFCVNETPMLGSAGHRYLYPEISQVFGGPSAGPKPPRLA